MFIKFKQKGDSINIYYVNAIDSGKYINGYSDSDENAGSFLKKDVKNDSVLIKVMSYRDNSQTSLIRLFFKSDSIISWKNKSTSDLFSYLPDSAIFHLCNK